MNYSSVCPVHATIIGYNNPLILINSRIYFVVSNPSRMGIERSINISPYENYFLENASLTF